MSWSLKSSRHAAKTMKTLLHGTFTSRLSRAVDGYAASITLPWYVLYRRTALFRVNSHFGHFSIESANPTIPITNSAKVTPTYWDLVFEIRKAPA
jgi:hypothetical protein